MRIAAFILLGASCLPAFAQVQLGVSGVYTTMTPVEVANNLSGRGIVSKSQPDGTLQFPLGDGTTKSTLRGTVAFNANGGDTVTSVEFSAEGDAAASQYVSWLYQTSHRYGVPRKRNLTGTTLAETFCYTRGLAVLLQLMERRAALTFSTLPEHLAGCADAPKKRDFEPVAYQVGPPGVPPNPSVATNRPAVNVERVAWEQRYNELGYCHAVYYRLRNLDILPPASRQRASESMVRVRDQARSVQKQLGYSDAIAEETFGPAASMRLTSGLKSQQDVQQALSECRAKNAV